MFIIIILSFILITYIFYKINKYKNLKLVKRGSKWYVLDNNFYNLNAPHYCIVDRITKSNIIYVSEFNLNGIFL